MALSRESNDIITAFDTFMNKVVNYTKPNVGNGPFVHDILDKDKKSKQSYIPNYSFLTDGITAASGLDFQVSGKYEGGEVEAVSFKGGIDNPSVIE